MLNDLIATPTVIAAIFGGVVVLIGNKLNNTIKMKSEIEDSRIEWIQHVRKVHLNIIKAVYQFMIDNNSYMKIENQIRKIEIEKKATLEGLISQKLRDQEEQFEKMYEVKLQEVTKETNELYGSLESKLDSSINTMYTAFSHIEEMKNLFPIKKYKIKRSILEDRIVLIAIWQPSIFLKKDEAITNNQVYVSLNKLKEDIKISFDNSSTFEEEKIEAYLELITNYLKIEWEKVKSKKT